MIDITKRKVFVVSGITDMRKGVKKLSEIIKKEFGMPIEPKTIFIFANKKRNIAKAIEYDINGQCMYYKKLNDKDDSFHWIWNSRHRLYNIKLSELNRLLGNMKEDIRPDYITDLGIDISSIITDNNDDDFDRPFS